jgi:CHAT domain-containing protein
VPRSDRILLFCLGSALLSWALLSGRSEKAPPEVRAADPLPTAPAPSSPPASSTARDYKTDYEAFLAELQAFRAGEVEDPGRLRAAAALLGEHHDREDAPRVVEYYASLSRSERRRGLEAYEEFLGLRSRVADQGGLDWSRELEALTADLRGFVARTLPAADFVPAGRGLALLAELEVHRLESLADDERRPELLEAATRHVREALAVFERAGMQTPRLEPLWYLGRLAVLEGREDRGRAHFAECLDLAVRTHQEEFRELALLRLIRLARDSGDARREQKLLAQLATFRDPRECWELARNHALQLIHEDEALLAAEFLIAHRPRADEELDDWRCALASARLRAGDLLEARRLIDALTGRGLDEYSLLVRATLDLRQGDSAAVLFALAQPSAELERLSPRGRSRAAALVGEAHLLEGRPAEALEALIEARRIAESWEARLEEQAQLATTSVSVMGEWLGLHSVVLEARALLQLDRPLEAALLVERAHTLHWRTGQRDARRAAEPLTEADLRAWAASFEHGLVTWISGADDGVAIHLAADGVAQGMELRVSRKALERGARRLRAALISGDEARAAALASELAESLLPASLGDALLAATANDGRLLCLAHGALEALPLEALVLEGRVLDERVALLVLPELPTRRPGAHATAAGEWSLLGAPRGAGGELRLPGALEELEDIRALRPEAHLCLGADFKRAALLEAVHSGRALHVATHLVVGTGCESELYDDVGLELSGADTLCAAEFAALETTAPLVVLAACETAGGRRIDARGQQGVARAWLEAGARDLLVTLWPIRDDVARRFTPIFHSALMRGESPARAARLARRALAESGVAAADWAAFRILGRD